jgi:sugar transferase (PEP-CTERM/EpsH1 system associated)
MVQKHKKREKVKVKIGVLLSRVPYPLEKGDKLRAFHQIRVLSKQHEIYLCAISAEKTHPKALEHLKPYCKEIKIIRLTKVGILINLIYSLLFTSLPLQVAYFYNRKAKKDILRFFSRHQLDHLYCQLIRTSEYVRDFNDVPKTLDFMDALSRGMERRIKQASFGMKTLFRIEATRLKRYEHFIFQAFDHKTIISEQDRDLIVHAQNHHIKVIRNGVDQDFFKPKKAEKKFDLLFTGNMSYPPNVDGVEFLVNQILPLVWKEKPEINLAIVGANPSPKVERLSQERVLVSGWVDDIRDYYAAAKVFIAPMQIGTGLQNKLLEAMSMQIPCITSPLANNALGGKHQENILIGEHPEEYKELVVKLLEDPQFADNISGSAQKLLSQRYTWEGSTKDLEALFLRARNQN